MQAGATVPEGVGAGGVTNSNGAFESIDGGELGESANSPRGCLGSADRAGPGAFGSGDGGELGTAGNSSSASSGTLANRVASSALSALFLRRLARLLAVCFFDSGRLTGSLR